MAHVAMCDVAQAEAPPALLEAVGEERAEDLWARRPPGPLPNAKRQAALIEWLQNGPLAADPDELLYPCLRREPRLFLRASSLRPLREAHSTVCSLLREDQSPERVAKAVAHEPTLLLQSTDALLAAASALSEITGLEGVLLTRVLLSEPALLLASSESVQRRVTWLDEELAIARGGRLQRVLTRAPLTMLVSLSSLRARLDCLEDMGVPREMHSALVVRSPRLLHTPLSRLRAKEGWLAEIGVLPTDGTGRAAAFGAFVTRQPDFFSLARSRLDAVCVLLGSLGLDEAQSASVIRAEPAALSIPEESLRLKAAFFTEVVGGSTDDLLSVPHVLTCDLNKVLMLRHAYCLTHGLNVEPQALLTRGDAQFCDEVDGCVLDDLSAFGKSGKHLTFFQGAAM